MNLEAFRDKVRQYRRPTAYSQQALARALGLHPTVLSHKLNGDPRFNLTNPEIKQIIKILAEWSAITSQSEAFELLELAGLKPTAFSPSEWQTPPLSELEINAVTTSLLVGGKAQPKKSSFSRVTPEPPAPDEGVAVTQKPSHNLPFQLTPLIGREQEINQVAGLLRRADVRLLTLSGIGGIGKTRLALQVGWELLEDFNDGVYFCDLSATSDPASLPFQLAQTLEIKLNGPKPLSNLKEWLQPKQILLIMDNFEQLLKATHMLKELMEAAPRLKIIVTSRVVLRLYGEYEFVVPPLKLPELTELNTGPVTLEELIKSEAVSLFVQRARMVQPAFQLVAENALIVAQICVRLDGLPLALELAATRLKVLSPAALLAHLGDAFKQSALPLLSGRGNSNDLANQAGYKHTLLSTIEWSYQALSAAEKSLFARLGVFAGSFTLEAAEKVCSGPELLETSVPSILEVLPGLLDKNMLRKLEGGVENRFGMLETLREYAVQQLTQQGELSKLREAHAKYYLGLAEQAEVGLLGKEQAGWLNRLLLEYANLRVALYWTVSISSSSELGLRLASALERFWRLMGYLGEGCDWLERALALNDEKVAIPRYRAKALNTLGNLLNWQGDYRQAQEYHQRSLQLYRQLEDKSGIASCLNGSGNDADELGDYDSARQYLEASLALRHELGEKQAEAFTLNNLGTIASKQGDYTAAQTYYQQSLNLLRQVGDKSYVARSLTNLGIVAVNQHQYEKARGYLEESAEIYREMEDRLGLAGNLNSVGQVLAAGGDYGKARDYFEQALVIYRKAGEKRGIALSLQNAGAAACILRDFSASQNYLRESLTIRLHTEERRGIIETLAALVTLAYHIGQSEEDRPKQDYLNYATVLSSAVKVNLERLGANLERMEKSSYEETVTGLELALGREEFEASWNKGQTMTLEEAAKYALSVKLMEEVDCSFLHP